MSDATRYPVPAGLHRVEHTIARSRFICTVQRAETVKAAQDFIRATDAELADATRNCWAYVIGAPGSTTSVGMSDDGEPHGTAGRPMLTVLLHSGVGEIAAAVTRYYGGTKLGTGGLVKAYGGAVQLALETMPTSERVDYVPLRIAVGYTSIVAVQQALAMADAVIDAQEFGLAARFRARVPRPNVDKLRSAVADATRGEGELIPDAETDGSGA